MTGAAGVGLAAAAGRPLFAAPRSPRPRADACISIFLGGGASHVDLFDPKPEMLRRAGEHLPPSLFVDRPGGATERAVLRPPLAPFAETDARGEAWSSLLPQLARVTEHLLVVRSVQTTVVDHGPAVRVFNTGHADLGRPSLGAWVAHVRGRRSRLPAHVALPCDPHTNGGPANWASGGLPTDSAGVVMSGPSSIGRMLHAPAGVGVTAQDRTLAALERLSGLRDGSIRALEADAREAVAVDLEPAEVRGAYGLLRRREGRWADFGADAPRHFAHAQRFAHNCLLARRLVERGVRFVSIFYSPWDHHQNLDARLPDNAFAIDGPLAALIGDLATRGLLDRTAVVVGTEFGRSPTVEGRLGSASAGRRHHPHAFSVLLAGGGFAASRAFGRTDDFGYAPVEDPLSVEDLQATLLESLGVDGTRGYRVAGNSILPVPEAARVESGLWG